MEDNQVKEIIDLLKKILATLEDLKDDI